MLGEGRLLLTLVQCRIGVGRPRGAEQVTVVLLLREGKPCAELQGVQVWSWGNRMSPSPDLRLS